MTKCFFLPGIFLTLVSSVSATEQFQLNFELTQGESKTVWGKDIVSQKSHTWTKGSKRNYLEMRCLKQESGKIRKVFSTADHFDGLLVTHRLAGSNLELTVVRNLVKPRLVEIRALPVSECKDLSPIVTRTSETYTFPAKDGVSEVRPFGENMLFRARLQVLGGSR